MSHRKFPKPLAYLMIMAMLMTMFTFAPMASAATSIEALSKPTVDSDTIDDLGTVFVQIRAGSLEDNDSVIFRLPSGFKFLQNNSSSADINVDTIGTFASRVTTPATYQGDTNGLSGASLAFQKLDSNEFKMTVSGLTYADDWDSYLYLDLSDIYIDEDAEGDINLVCDAPAGSGFPDGSVVVGKVGAGAVDITVVDDPTFSDDVDVVNDPVTIRIEEDIKGALTEDEESLKFVLPAGFEWQAPNATTLDMVWGDWNSSDPVVSTDKNDVGDTSKDLVIYAEGDELIIAVNNESDSAACFELTLGINVEDETDAKAGDVVAKVRGASDVDDSEITVGHYGQYDVTIEVDGDAPTVYAGMLEQEVADIKITESVKKSLMPGRTIILTLPANAKWGAVDDGASDSSVDLDFVGFVGDDGRAIKYEVGDNQSSDAAELTLEDMEVVLEPGVSGDLTVEVSGTQGLEGELVLAKVVTPITATAEKTNVKIGAQAQPVGDITITEAEAGAIKDDEDIIIDLPDGVKFSSVPEVKVTEGDLEIDESGVKRQEDDNQLVIPIDRDSTDPSTIVISGIEYTLDRTVAEGDITVKIKGNALVEVNDDTEMTDYWGDSHGTTAGYDEDDAVYFSTASGLDSFNVKEDGLWPASTSAAKVVNATTTTPAPSEKTVSFKVGDEGVVAMNGRTLVQVNLLCDTLGLQKSWDAASKTAYFVKDGTVVAFPIGKNQIIVNGNTIPVDQGGVAYNNFTYATLRGIQMAFGGDLTWDQATQTATFKF